MVKALLESGKGRLNPRFWLGSGSGPEKGP